MPPTPSAPTPSRRRGLLAGVLSVVMVGAAGAGAWVAATEAADLVEARATRDLRRALADPQFAWTEVRADGLGVTLGGTAPDETARFRAIAAAGTAVDPSRIIDEVTVAGRAPVAPPPVKVELLRSGDGVTVIGLVPEEVDRRRIAEAVEGGTRGAAVTDLVEVAGSEPPEDWRDALTFGAAAIRVAPNAKVSIEPGRVSVTALAASPEARDATMAELNRTKPEGVELTLAITAPLPVISPFTLRFVRDEGGARFDACAADTDAARERILAAARQAGMDGTGDCRLGIGVPTPAWADAAAPAIAAVGEMGAGAVTFTNADIALEAPYTVPQPAFDEAVARLRSALPPVFRLTATLEPLPEPATVVQPASFTATRAADGALTLRGRVPDERMRNAVDSFARARFASVDSVLTVDPSVPDGWTVRVIAALEAMTDLSSGSATVGPEEIDIAGVSGVEAASDRAAEALGRRLGAGARYSLAIRYDRWLDAALGLPTGEQCADRANAVMATSEIGFEPGGAEIAGDVAPVMTALSAALKDCEAFRLEVGGHTDSQGSEGGNMTLSQRRAAAVLAAMAGAGINVTNTVAVGYGESQPVASNEDDAGREANRRIEFRLVSPEPVEGPPPEVAPLTGVTSDAPPEGAPPAEAQPPQTPEEQLEAVPAELRAEGTPEPPDAAPTADAQPQNGADDGASAEPAAAGQLAWPDQPPARTDLIDPSARPPVAVRPYAVPNAADVAPARGEGYIDPTAATPPPPAD